MTLTPEQLHILQHSLGCDKHGRGTGGWPHEDEGDGCFGFYRNHYCSDPRPDLEALTAAGFMKRYPPRELSGGMCTYTVTKEGLLAMRTQSPPPPKHTRSQERFRRFRSEDSGESFREWLLRQEHNRKLERYGAAEPRTSYA